MEVLGEVRRSYATTGQSLRSRVAKPHARSLTIRRQRCARELKQLCANLYRKHALVRKNMRDPRDGALGQRLNGSKAVAVRGADGGSGRRRHGEELSLRAMGARYSGRLITGAGGQTWFGI